MMGRLLLLLLTATLLTAVPAAAVEPTIVVYSGTDSGFAAILAELIENDTRINSQTRVVNSLDLITLATALPQTEAIIIYASSKAEIEGLDQALPSYFQQGGGLIGMREPCYVPSAPTLATEVFQVQANTSIRQLSPAEKRVRTYTTQENTEINDGLPQTFELLSMGTYYTGDAEGNYINIHQEYTIPYKDQGTGSPLVLTYQNQQGGRTTAMPGVWAIPSARLDVYYGKIAAQPDFARLFTNIVLWTAKGSTRYNQVQQDLDQKIQEVKTRKDRLQEEAEKARKKEQTQRLILLTTIWAAGLAACAIITKKIILTPITEEE
jgi:hypothetical protein